MVSTKTEESKEDFMQLTMMLFESKCFRFYLKGSVIPFIYIADVKNLLAKNSKYLNEEELQHKIETIKKVETLGIVFQNKLKAIQELKMVLLRSCKLER